MASENTISEPPSKSEEVQKASVVPQLSWSKADRKRNKKLRNAGLEYVSRSGRTIAAKKQPEVICNCPQQCSAKVPKDVRERLFADFYALADANSQNAFLQKYIEIRSVNKRLYNEERKESGRLQRRVTCKYRIPLKLPPRDNKLTPELNDTPTENNVSIGNGGPELNDTLGENNASIGNADTTAASEDSDDDDEEQAAVNGEADSEMNGVADSEMNGEADSKMNGEADSKMNGEADSEMNGDKSGKEGKVDIKIEIKTELNDPTNLNLESLQDAKITETSQDDTNQPEDLCIRKPKENGLQADSKLQVTNDIKEEAGKEVACKEEKPDLNDVGKENEIKPEAPVALTEKSGEVNLSNGKMRVQGDLLEVCQKAFMNIFAITEKRVRLQREKIIDNLRFVAEQRKAEQEEMENTLSVARELAAGCRPLLQFMDKSNQKNRIPSLPKQLLMAIDNDITLVNNFFRNQLWKPENFSKRYKKSDGQNEPDFLSESDILD